MDSVPVSILLSSEAKYLDLKLVYGKNFVGERYLDNFKIQKVGLGLAGYTEHIVKGRVQIFGRTEIFFLWSLDTKKRCELSEKLCKKNISCIVVTGNLHIPCELLKVVKNYEIPLFKTHFDSAAAIRSITSFLEDKLAPFQLIHGVLVDVYGVGVLIIGRSGIGKSECALELIKRGHRLVADDIANIKLKEDYIVGTSDELLRFHLEIRGLGVLNIKDIYGINSIRLRKKVESVVNLVDWDNENNCDRTGLDEKQFNILGVNLPLFTVPVSPGRNIAVIIEAASKNLLLKIMDYDTVERFDEKLSKKIAHNRKEIFSDTSHKKGIE